MVARTDTPVRWGILGAANIAAGNLRFAPAANTSGAAYSSFTFELQDNGGTANGGVAREATPHTMTIDVSPINHAPQGSDVIGLHDGDARSNPGTGARAPSPGSPAAR